MKLTRPLSPSLESIERRLFGVNPVLIAAVERGETSKDIAQAVMKSEEWARRAEADEQLPEPVGDTSEVRLAEHVLDVIRRRSDAMRAAASLTSTVPAPGLIVELSEIRTPKPGQLDWVMQVPLHVLLDEPDETPQVWHGWLVSGEPDYASWWDFVLQDQDEPFEPFACVVQLWNPVQVYLPMISKAVSSLSLRRLQAVRALAADFVDGTIPPGVPVWPGRVAVRETSDGMIVATGSPLGGERDPRHRYQHLLHHAAEAVREPARLAIAAAVAPSARTSLMAGWIEAARRLGEMLQLQPRVAVAMSGEGAGDADLIWPDHARISILELADDGAGRIVVSALGDQVVTVELRVAGVLHHKQTVSRDGTAGTFEWDADRPMLLTLSTPDGRKLSLERH
jgi:hypothetical protein